MSKSNAKLSTENGFIKGVLGEALKPLFSTDEKNAKTELMITRRIINLEQKFYLSLDTDASVLRKNSLGTLLYELIIYKYNKEGSDYVTQDIVDSRQGSKDEIINNAWELYQRTDEFTLPVYGEKYFDSRDYKHYCGPIQIDKLSHERFLERIKDLLTLEKHLSEIFDTALGSQAKPGVAIFPLEKTNKFGITSRDYYTFDIGNLLDKLSHKNKMMNTQISYFLEYLSNFEAKPALQELVIKLKSVCSHIPDCLPEEGSNLQKLIKWEMQRLKIALACRPEQQIFISSLQPLANKDVQAPSAEELRSSEKNQAILENLTAFTKSILGQVLPKECGKIYVRLSTKAIESTRLEKQKKSLEKLISEQEQKMCEISDDEIDTTGKQININSLDEEIKICMDGLADLSTRSLSVSPEMLAIMRHRFFLLFQQERYQRLGTLILNDTVKENILAAQREISAELKKNDQHQRKQSIKECKAQSAPSVAHTKLSENTQSFMPKGRFRESQLLAAQTSLAASSQRRPTLPNGKLLPNLTPIFIPT